MYIKILKMSYSCLYTLYFRACFYVVHHIMSYQGTILEKEKYIYRILIYIYIRVTYFFAVLRVGALILKNSLVWILNKTHRVEKKHLSLEVLMKV